WIGSIVMQAIFLTRSYTARVTMTRAPKRRKHTGPIDEKTIGKRLRDARIMRGITQVQLAQKLAIDQSLISEYERGVVRVHGSLLASFAKVLRISLDEVLGLKPPRRNGVTHDAQLARRVARMGQLGKRDRQTLIRSIDHFLKGAGVPE